MKKLISIISLFLVLSTSLHIDVGFDSAQSATIHALNWNLANTNASSDVRLRWTGAALPPRWPLTILYKYRPRQQTGFYATFWYTAATEAFNGQPYYNGGLPYPPGGSGGTTHKWEVAHDGTDTQSSQDVVKGVWYPQAFVSSLDGSSNLNYIYYWATDSGMGASYQITAQTTAASLVTCVCTSTSVNAGAYIMEAGASPWESGSNGAGTNDETLSGWLRDVQVFDTILSSSDITTEMATESNAAVTAVGIRHLWYSNLDPIPTDVTDKSGAGHDPAWANALRPTQFDSTIGSSSGGKRTLLHAGN